MVDDWSDLKVQTPRNLLQNTRSPHSVAVNDDITRLRKNFRQVLHAVRTCPVRNQPLHDAVNMKPMGTVIMKPDHSVTRLKRVSTDRAHVVKTFRINHRLVKRRLEENIQMAPGRHLLECLQQNVNCSRGQTLLGPTQQIFHPV